MADQPIPFISINNGSFHLTPQAERFLGGNGGGGACSLGVVSVVGERGTGKTFFANQVLLGKQQQQQQPLTSTGLWVWPELVSPCNPDFPDMKAIVVDMQATGDEERDSKLVLLQLLLSSCFVFTSVGPIDDLSAMGQIVNLMKDVQVKETATTGSGGFFPSLLWVVRDLQGVDQSKEYLERALEQQKGFSDSVEQKNRVRRLVKHFFRERDCVVMEQSKQDQLKQVRSRVLRRVRPKSISGVGLCASAILQLARSFVQCVNSGVLPNVDVAWTEVRRAEGERVLTECMEVAEAEIKRAEQEGVTGKAWAIVKQKIQETAVKRLRLLSEDEMRHHLEQFNNNLEQRIRGVKRASREALKSRAEKVFQERAREMEARVRGGVYSNFFDFQGDVARMRDSLERDFSKQDKAVWVGVLDRALIGVFACAAEHLSRKAVLQMTQEVDRVTAQLAKAEEEARTISLEYRADRVKSARELSEWQRRSEQAEELERDLRRHVEELSSEAKQAEEERKERCVREQKMKENYETQLEVLRGQIAKLKSENQALANGHDKKLALLAQEGEFSKREMRVLAERFHSSEAENRKLRQEGAAMKAQIDVHNGLASRVNSLDLGRVQEVAQLQKEFERKVLELTRESDGRKVLAKQQGEWMVEKNYLETQVSFLKSQLEENKRLHDALLIVLSCEQCGCN